MLNKQLTYNFLSDDKRVASVTTASTELHKCDWLCEKGSYSFSKLSTLVIHNFSSF